MLSSIPYGTFANYSPRGQSELSQKSRVICAKIKGGRLPLDKVVLYLRLPSATVLLPFLDPSVTFVPVPRSAPLTQGALWPSLVIAEQLRQFDYGETVLPIIKRISAVRKSSTAGRNRPSVDEHYQTLKVERDLYLQPEKITLVDDVLTKGNTVFACALRLHEQFPEAEIRAFALIRTQGLIPEITSFVDPSSGLISYNSAFGTVDRNP